MIRLKSARGSMPRAGRLSTLFVALSTLGAGLVGVVASAAPAAAATSTTVVGAGDIAPNGPWSLEPTSNTGTYSFVSGPATPPSGSGSLAMSIASGQHEWLNNYAYGICATGTCNTPATMTPIVNVDALGFSTYRTSGTTIPTINVEVWTTGVSGSYTTFFFVPDSASIVNNTWQTWDGLNAADGTWYSSHQLASGVFNCAPQSAGCNATWSQIQADYPNAKIVFGLGPNVGTGGTFSGDVDNFTLGISGNTTVFDFEPDCTTTCYVNGATGDDLNTGSSADPLKTIQAGVTKVSANGTVQVAAGTYAENVTVPKAVTIAGAGQASTKIEPAVTNPNCSGGGSGSLCTGGTAASNVILVQSNNVTIHDLTVDGDNPALTGGFDSGGANIDARNGIITNHDAGTWQSLSVHDVTVKNIFLRGIYASSGGSFNFTNDTVDNVQADPASIAMFDNAGSGVMTGNHVSNANDALSANHSTGTQFTNNVITASGSGVHSDNNGDSGGTADLISGNTVSSCMTGGYGVFSFVPYLSQTISNNHVSGCAVGVAVFSSCAISGVSNCPGSVLPTTTVTGNSVTGIGAGSAGLYITTDSLGFGDGNLHVSADHNTFSGNEDGVDVVETGTSHATVSANRNGISGNTTTGLNNAGATTVNATCNWWGQSSGPAGGEVVGPATTAPWLTTSNLNSNCVPVAKISPAAVSVVEGNSGTTPVTLNVTLDRASSSTVTVAWRTLDGTAGASDYQGAFGTLTFLPGQTSKPITVRVVGDAAVEGNETFSVQLTSSTNAYLLGVSRSVITIKNDDKPKLSVGSVAVTEGANATFTLTLSKPYYQPIVVNVSSANGTAHANGDYTALLAGRKITIPAGSTTGSISMVTKTDGLTEPAETFTTTYASTSVSNSPVTATATILANHT